MPVKQEPAVETAETKYDTTDVLRTLLAAIREIRYRAFGSDVQSSEAIDKAAQFVGLDATEQENGN